MHFPKLMLGLLYRKFLEKRDVKYSYALVMQVILQPLRRDHRRVHWGENYLLCCKCFRFEVSVCRYILMQRNYVIVGTHTTLVPQPAAVNI